MVYERACEAPHSCESGSTRLGFHQDVAAWNATRADPLGIGAACWPSFQVPKTSWTETKPHSARAGAMLQSDLGNTAIVGKVVNAVFRHKETFPAADIPFLCINGKLFQETVA